MSRSHWLLRAYDVKSGDLIHEEPFALRLSAVVAAHLLRRVDGTRWASRRALTRHGAIAVYLEPVVYRVEKA